MMETKDSPNKFYISIIDTIKNSNTTYAVKVLVDM